MKFRQLGALAMLLLGLSIVAGCGGSNNSAPCPSSGVVSGGRCANPYTVGRELPPGNPFSRRR